MGTPIYGNHHMGINMETTGISQLNQQPSVEMVPNDMEIPY